MKKLFNIALALIATATVSTYAFAPVSVNAEAAKSAVLADSVNTYYSDVDASSGQSLVSSLHTIISNHKDIGYKSVWQAYYTTDIKPGTTDIIWDMYSNYNYRVGKDQAGNYSKEGDKYNREHSVPKSWFKEATPMHNDLFHLYPTDGYVNGKRSNYPFGEVGSATYTSGNGSKLGTSNFESYKVGTVFEPIDEYKGDFARTYFYMAVCYNDKDLRNGDGSKVFTSTYPYLTDYAKDLFTKWDQQDPVSEKEINRNNAIQKIQNNRNPFIDHPEFVSSIWSTKYNQNVTVDQNKVDAVIAKIVALPEVSAITLDDKEKVDAANALYLELNYKEKQAVINYSKLQDVLAKITELSGGNPVVPEPVPNKALTVAEALKIINSLKSGEKTTEKYKVTGTITGNIEAYQEKYGNATFDMNDGASTDNITVFRAKDNGGVNFTASSFASKVAVGKVITVDGYLQKYLDNKTGNISLEITNAQVVETITPSNPDDPDTPTPTPTPTPQPQKEEVILDLDSIETESWQKDFIFKIDDYSFKANVCQTNSKYYGGLRIGGNKSNVTPLPTKFGIKGNGGALEMMADAENALGIEFKISDKAQMTGKGSAWQILASTDGGNSWIKVASGKDAEKDTIAANLSAAAPTVRFAFIIEGDTARIDLGSVRLKLNAASTKVVLADKRTNACLDINYTIEGEEVKAATLKTVILTHIDFKYNLEDVEYGIIYTKKTNLEKLVRKYYTSGDAASLATLVSGTYVKAKLEEADDDIIVSATVELEYETDYVAVVVCEQNGKLVFANQIEVNNKAMVEYYLGGIVTDAEQIKVLEFLNK